jgi:hypothetical protein
MNRDPDVLIKYNLKAKVFSVKVSNKVICYIINIEEALASDLLKEEFLIDVHNIGDSASKDRGEFIS